MKLVKTLSLIGVAGYLVLDGLYGFSQADNPMAHSAVGLIGLVSGALIFISLSRWADLRDKK